MNIVKHILIFSVGVSIGVLSTRQYFNQKYNQIAQEEIDSVKEVFSKRSKKEDISDEIDETKPIVSKGLSKKYKELLSNLDYSHDGDYANSINDLDASTEEHIFKPYVIRPDEFGEKDEYDTVSLTCWSDLVLTDDCDVVVDNVEDTVGNGTLKRFGEFEDDSVFVRDDRKRIDYEILWDTRKYEDYFNDINGN